MPELRRAVLKIGSYLDDDGVVHLCFAWFSEVLQEQRWSSFCMLYDSIEDVDTPADMPTCVRCYASWGVS